MITAYGTVASAVSAMQLGADDFIEKPVDLAQLRDKIARLDEAIAISEDAVRVAGTLDRSRLPVRIIGESRIMQRMLSLALRMAATPWPVLVSGETGTGKELIARLIHRLSPRADGPLVAVNCGAIPETLFESELFGHERGAFTGAAGSRRGRFELADGGTLLLDEIGELPLTLQPKLLRAIQEKRIMRVGAEREIPVDIRVVAATNRDIRREVDEGRFREDLYYRLKVLEIDIPPLRQRKEDLPALVAHFIGRHGSRPIRFSAEAMTALGNYHFPGNVRELEQIIQRVIALSRGTCIAAADLPAEIRYHTAMQRGTLDERLSALERELIVSALDSVAGVQTRAAELLGISERVLRYKLKKHCLEGRGSSSGRQSA
jgi:DNA-binding NtrC family response regulator